MFQKAVFMLWSPNSETLALINSLYRAWYVQLDLENSSWRMQISQKRKQKK